MCHLSMTQDITDTGRLHILSPVQVQGDATCLKWSRCHRAMHPELFGIDWYTWQNPVTMWLSVGVVRFLSDKMWISNQIKLWKICKNPSRVLAHLSPVQQFWTEPGTVIYTQCTNQIVICVMTWHHHIFCPKSLCQSKYLYLKYVI